MPSRPRSRDANGKPPETCHHETAESAATQAESGIGAMFPTEPLRRWYKLPASRAMSAKKSKSAATQPAPTLSAATAPAPAAASPAAPTAAPDPSWLDAPDPRKRLWGKLLLVGVWVYVAALWLL